MVRQPGHGEGGHRVPTIATSFHLSSKISAPEAKDQRYPEQNVLFPAQSQQVNEVEEVIKELKTNPGFSAYVIMNNDGEPLPTNYSLEREERDESDSLKPAPTTSWECKRYVSS